MRFKKVYIEILNTCNLSCSFCVQNQRPERRMRVEEFTHVIQQIQPYTGYVYLHILGEPLMHPELSKLLTICSMHHIQVNLTTNGTLLKQRLPILLQQPVRQINISVHSFQEHDHISTSDYLEQIWEAGSEMAQNQTYVSYRLWNMKGSGFDQDTLYLVSKFQEKFHCDIKEKDMVKHRSIPLCDHMYLNFEESFVWPSLSHDVVSTQSGCLGTSAMCGILSDGRVVPCCLDSNGDCSFGNIFDTPFEKIVQSSAFQEVYHGFLQKRAVSSLCRRCAYRLRFL